MLCRKGGCGQAIRNPNDKFCSVTCAVNYEREKSKPVCAREGCNSKVNGPHHKFCSVVCAASI